ncbi:MAG: citramalate synthase, partial [Desulfovibrio sp.]|nr:citramalate synthase [Desulfovibrio sp.]
MKNIIIYDTTLRDGNQAEDINFSLEDKIKIALKLDELGIAYIEGGWPGASPVDTAFFKEISAYTFKCARIAAFGSTHHPAGNAENDSTLGSLISSNASCLCIFGKSAEGHLRQALRITPERYLEVIHDSVAFLKQAGKEVFFDAEHFFSGYAENSDFSLAVVKKAHEAGADMLVLCDTNGGTLPYDIANVVTRVGRELPTAALGIHAHNDCELAVAASLAAVEAGAGMVQGSINGIGERCGNTNLCSIM